MYNGYVPLRRGIVEHLPKMPNIALKVYIYLLCQARFEGEDKGKVFMPLKDIAADLKISYLTVKRAIKFLSNHYVTYTPAPNQYTVSQFYINKYDKIAGIKKDTSTVTSKSAGFKNDPSKGSASIKSVTTADTSDDTSKPSNLNKDKELQFPNKDKKDKKKEVLDTTYLPFETSVFNSWNSMCDRNSTLSKVIALSEERKKKLKERFKNSHFRENIFKAIEAIPKYPFLLGVNARGWKATFKWIIHNDDNYLEVLEGSYGKPKSKIDEIIESAKRR